MEQTITSTLAAMSKFTESTKEQASAKCTRHRRTQRAFGIKRSGGEESSCLDAQQWFSFH